MKWHPPPASLKRRLRLEALDERAVPDGNPGSPPNSPPPVVGNPAAQATQQVWAYVLYSDGAVAVGQFTVDAPNPTAGGTPYTSLYDGAQGAIVAATASFAGQTAVIQPPANVQAGLIYYYDAATGNWTSTAVPATGMILSPAAGYRVTPIFTADGTGVAFATLPAVAVLATNVASTFPPPIGEPETPRPPTQPPPPPLTPVLPPPTLPYLPPPTVIPGSGPPTVIPPPPMPGWPPPSSTTPWQPLWRPVPQPGTPVTPVPTPGPLGPPIGPNGLPIPYSWDLPSFGPFYGPGIYTEPQFYGPFQPGANFPPYFQNPYWPPGYYPPYPR